MVKNVQGLNQVSVAEHVFALLLSFSKNIYSSVKNSKNGDWKRETGFNLKGKKIGVVGFGNIGKEVSRIAKAFSMEVFAYDKYIDIEEAKKIGVKNESSLKKLISNVDIISLHLPLLEDTKEIINRELLSNAKESLIIINTARGGLVDEAAIYELLKERKIRAYLADVLQVEPMEKSNKLKDLENVLITQHIASRTIENVEAQGLMAVKNLVSALKEFENVQN